MPRPGPRPYECVRRAWHSDRHQPIRGSLIQEIFRVVNEIHSSASKKNKEWQEKLPIVVLKAEEIMYSKANSEAEYMDLKTLWDRTNDAINTIIRRDESTETGALLQPCIEAALNLGCTPRRASRSQRNSDPRYYLSPSAQEPSTVPAGSLENTTKEDNTTKSPYMSHCLNFLKPTTWNLTHSGSESQSPIALNNNCTTNKFTFASENVPIPTNNQCLPLKYYPASNLHSVYPLYYGNHFQVDVPITNHGFKILPKSNSNSLEPAKMIVVQNLFSCNLNASNQVTQTDIKDIVGKNQCEIECDLSLRLGPLSVPCVSVKNIHPHGVEDVASNTSRQGSQFNDLSAQINKEFTFFRRSNVDDPLDSCSGKWSFVEGEHVNADATVRKRKAILSPSLEDQQFCWQPKLPDNHLTGRMRHAGL